MLTMYAGMLVDSGPTDEAISVGAAVAWAEEVKAAWERNSGEVGSAFVVGVGIGYRLGITGTMLALELEAAQVAEMLAGIALTEGKPDVYH
jgi:ABC-type tungstate transport system substrate-binding protein